MLARQLSSVVGRMPKAALARPLAAASRCKATLQSEPWHPDPEGLLEYSVVYTDRSLNHMSNKFQGVMNDISSTLKQVYKAEQVAIVPGGGTYTMEAVARQFATGNKCLVIRSGYFSFRWSQIFEAGSLPSEEIVLKARPVEEGPNPAYAPCPIEEVVATIEREKPAVVFTPHVETSAGIMLPDDYITAVADAVHKVGGIFVLDCIASGCVWVDMAKTGVDVIISAPQKGWSGPPCAGLAMLSQRAVDVMAHTKSNSFTIDLKKWCELMKTYENGGHMYHATMPTDALTKFRDVQLETAKYGFDKVKEEQLELGRRVRAALKARGIKSVAADGFGAPGVTVSYTDDAAVKSGAKFAAQGMQIAAGVPLMVDDFTSGPDFLTFRLGLFGLEKLHNIDRTVELLEERLDGLAAGVAKPITMVATGKAKSASAKA